MPNLRKSVTVGFILAKLILTPNQGIKTIKIFLTFSGQHGYIIIQLTSNWAGM